MRSGEVVVEVVRSGFVESLHRGSVVALGADGAVDWAVGDPRTAIFPRSCNKPLQAVGMLRSGLPLDGELLALVCASHSGEPFHLDGVRQILAGAGLSEEDLLTPPDYPLDDVTREEWIRSGAERSALAMNCSGKHAGMLATCVLAGWPRSTYRSPDHPLQQAIASVFSELTEEPIPAVGVDGCGAPLFATSLVGLARGFRALALGPDGSAQERVAQALRAFPQWASGTRRDEAALLRGIPGAIGKAGAEGCYAVALPDGRAVALKIDDGTGRARPVLMCAALRRLGLQLLVLDEIGAVSVLGGGEPVGELRALI